MQEIKSSVLCCLTDLVKLDNVKMIAVCDEKKSSSEDATKSCKPKKEQDLVRKRYRNKTLTSDLDIDVTGLSLECSSPPSSRYISTKVTGPGRQSEVFPTEPVISSIWDSRKERDLMCSSIPSDF